MRHRFHVLPPSAFLLVLALAIAACGGTDEPEAAPAPTTPAPAEEVDTRGESDADEAPAPDVQLEERVVIAGSGGAFMEGFLRVLEPWAQEHGVQIDWVEGLATEHTGRIVAQQGSPEIDLFQGELVSHFAAAGQDVFAPYDPMIVTNLETWPEEFRLADGTAVNITVDAVGIMYNEERFQEEGIEPPQTWEDFDALLDDERLRGRFAFPHIDNGYMRGYVATQLERMGHDSADPTPVFERLAERSDWVYEFPGPPAGLADLYTAGQVWIAVNGQSRIVELPAVIVLPPDTPITPHSWSLVKNGPNPNAAQSLVNFLLSEEGQRRLFTESQFSPAQPPPDVGDDPRKLSAEDIDRLFIWDYATVQQSLEGWRDAWARAGLDT
jgi:putative spermidine/putrescine transport system substrate-binding protein